MITYFNPLQLFFLVIFPSTFVEFLLTTSVFKKFCTQWYGFIYGLCEILSGFIFAKKLFANEKHSYAKPIPLNILVMSLAGTYLFAILDRIAESYEEELDLTIQRLTSMIEPIIIILLAVVVGFIIAAVLLPLLDFSTM